ncbi:hypothetical protein PAHAL_3G468500 [Panicum hallii]|uniref:Uncharacterized protein n=1 Tax=Panicum hallii TaxID=206008 RepID=A0A2S3HER7_9POAL|nr:uncharacterized protein LOC112887799 [Panicum hallii]PAN21464.1 hypothetical protein PAHAL_3G468500 [Panicum hallii]
MAGADGSQRRPWDLSRRAASFLRMARLALAGAAPAQLLAEEEKIGGGHICDPYYKSISTEDDWESDGLWLEEDESELLEDGSTARGVSSEISTPGSGPLNKRSQFIRHHRPATAGAALRPENNAAAAAVAEDSSSEPLVPRRPAKRANDAEMVHHPFGCDRRGSESSSLLLVSS